jgi:biopolymer transport protein ExbD
MDFQRNVKRSNEISMIPLINVVFLLVIFFLIAGNIGRFDVIDIEVPQAKNGQKLEEGDVIIMLGRYDEVIMNNKFYVSVEEIRKPLEEFLTERPNAIITLKADNRIDAFRLLSAMDIVKASGGKNISLVTQSQGS